MKFILRISNSCSKCIHKFALDENMDILIIYTHGMSNNAMDS